MKLGIMQPYFFPYLGYFSLIKHTDQFILLDTVQFIRHGWIERNRILKPTFGWQYIKVPLKKFPHTSLIKDINIDNSTDWKNKIKAQLLHYKKKAPFYTEVIKLLDEIFSSDFRDIVSLDKEALVVICRYLEIKKEIEIFSKLDLQMEPVSAPDEWALNICKSIIGVKEYWNPIRGESFFDKSKYEQSNLVLKFHTMNLPEYNQQHEWFETALSIIDVLMFNSVNDTNLILDNYRLT